MQLSEGNGHTLLNIARASIIAAFRGNSPSIETNDPELLQPAGCFVSLHSLHNHALRGCVGRMDAVEPLIRCVRDTAQSVLCDPRFLDRPILFEELGALAIDIVGLDPSFALAYLVYVLIVVAVGGLGSIGGTFAAAMLLGISDMAGKYYFPAIGSFLIYLVMLSLLMWRPSGIFGRRV